MIWKIHHFFSENWMIPSGYAKIAMENGPVEIVDFPMKHGEYLRVSINWEDFQITHSMVFFKS